eukprot:1160494-Pelagomonas_calceolata.AAC.19
MAGRAPGAQSPPLFALSAARQLMRAAGQLVCVNVCAIVWQSRWCMQQSSWCMLPCMEPLSRAAGVRFCACRHVGMWAE